MTMEWEVEDEEEFEPNKENGSLQHDNNNTLEATIDLLEKTTQSGGSGGLCTDSHHLHSFRSVPFLVLPIYTCAGCEGKLQPYMRGGTSSIAAAVKCQACGVYAHRKCAFSKHIKWHRKCSSVMQNENTNGGAFGENSSDVMSEIIDDAKTEHDKNPTHIVSDQLSETEEGDKYTHFLIADDTSSRASSSVNFLESIFRRSGDQHTQFSVADDTSSHVSSSANFLESIFRRSSRPTREVFDKPKLPALRVSASVDNTFRTGRRTRDVQRTKANFPFLSSVSLLPSHNKTESRLHALQKCKTWDGVIETLYPIESEDSHFDSTVEIKNSSIEEYGDENQTDEHLKDNTNTDDTKGETAAIPLHCAEKNYGDDNGKDDGNTNDTEGETKAPLHFASHGFRLVSQVLQENIIANFNRLIPKDDSNKEVDTTEVTNESDTEKDSPLPTTDSTSAGSESPPNKKMKSEADDSQARSLLETSEPEQDSIVDRKRLGLATVAGSIVGGVVGVGLAGPVGGMIGVKCGQTAGMLGLLLEGSVTASVWASGITAGIAAGQRIQERHETHVLALGEGTKQRVLLMVRPTIQPPEPEWDEIYQKARKSYSGGNSGFVNRLISNECDAAKRERYEREVDIVETGEDELAIGDKVLLLVSRILSNKDSLPGHVYRKLIEAFRRRSRELDLQDLYRNKHEQKQDDESTVAPEDGDEQVEDEQFSRLHQRRRDTHAVIKYVTTSLLLTRPGFGHSASFTEKTATAVESLVFGEIYDLVMEEIEMEHQDRDDLLLEKIADFERRQGQGEDPTEIPKGANFGYKSYISEGALEALHCLPQAHSAVDKLRYCVIFLEQISEKFSNTAVKSVMGADSLLKMVCQHILLAKVIGINSQIAFLEEFARDEQLLRGREGYALVTLQASLHFLNSSTDFESDIFGEDSD
eukprot:CAMPEP_0172363852 /NCGR_PEP_ID=MMETSP1060-20121228/7098_1 /TAXON_ID=37318 /ORGANISM="Pseudo-nitzschia pungens, Strain cf. cingulata" /LENGTH=925 /DNA_ID=CAMNT_0013086691 /DNA_START=308 /DNA_END=3085 /DNA_ORIENTATION=-